MPSGPRVSGLVASSMILPLRSPIERMAASVAGHGVDSTMMSANAAASAAVPARALPPIARSSACVLSAFGSRTPKKIVVAGLLRPGGAERAADIAGADDGEFHDYTITLPSSVIASSRLSAASPRIISLCARPDGIIGKQFSFGSTTQSNSTGLSTSIISLMAWSRSPGFSQRMPTA